MNVISPVPEPPDLYPLSVGDDLRDERFEALRGTSERSGGARVITGAHAILYSAKPDADRAFIRDVLALPSVDVGGGWLIFGLPQSEIAVHPAEESGRHELFLLVADVAAFVARMKSQRIKCGALRTERWGIVTNVTLPGGGTIGVYEPLHGRPPAARPSRTAAKPRSASRAPASASKRKRKT